MAGLTDEMQRRTPSDGTAWKDRLGRIGLAGRGVLYAVIGVLALQLAFGSPSDEDASSSGAMAWIAEQPFGKFLLVALTLALFSLAAWRFLDAAVGDPVEGSETKDRVKFFGQGILYLSLAIASLSITVANWSSSSGDASGSGDGQTQEQAAAVVLDWPMGWLLVAAAGVAVIGYALYVVKSNVVDTEFTERLGAAPDAVIRLGRVGYAARAAVFTTIGILLISAGLSHDSDEAGGLSAALQEMADTGWGPWLLGAVAAGLFAFGAFCIAEAKFRRAA